MSDTDHISKLYLFSKETEATDVIRGFKFQELKTLEIWIANRINKVDENIYCEYEDDIFQRDLNDFKATFRQIKLYSSKRLSLASQELIKTINHFFMLFVKGDYLFDKPTFIFETNTSFAAQRGDEDSELLKDWFENQEKLTDELVTRCILKVKSIIEVYIDSCIEKSKDENEKSKFIEAKSIFKGIPEETWRDFIKAIKWIFTGLSSEDALEQSVGNCMNLISLLPFPIAGDQHTIVFDTLRGIVTDRSIADEPENRLLNNDLLDHALLNLGSRDDKEYKNTYELWKGVRELENFRIGEFYQVLFASKYCRRKPYLEENSMIWINLLDKYIILTRTKPKFWRQAVYEFIWSAIRPSIDTKPVTSLDGFEEIINEYFENIEEFEDANSLEDAMNLLTLTATHQQFGLVNIDFEVFISWFDRLNNLIVEVKAKTTDKNTFCGLLEIEGFTYLNREVLQIGEKNREKAMLSLNTILEKLKEAPFYAISQLGQRLDDIVRLRARFGLIDGYEDIEQFIEEISPLVKDRDGNFSQAKRYTNKAADYLNSKNPQGLLKALDLLHKAKDLYFEESTYEGLVLVLMNISQLYASIGMNLAAKYYALSAIWFCAENDDSKLYKRISDSYGLLYYMDFKQGSWMTAINDFENYYNARVELDPNPFDPSTDEMLQKTLIEHTFLLALLPEISNQLTGFTQYEKTKMGQLYIDYLEEGIEFITQESRKNDLKEFVSRKIDSPPIDDIGDTRVIKWKCFGSIWNVEFKNDYLSNSIAEEYASLMQIIQADIALSRIDFHLLKGTIRLVVEITESIKEPEQLPSWDEYLWKVYLTKLHSKEGKDKNIHYAFITTSFQTILNEISLLEHKLFLNKFMQLFKNGLARKTLAINSYQREYRRIYSEEIFIASMRAKFESASLEIDYHESKVLEWISGESEYYKKKVTLDNISRRVRGCINASHLTLERLNKSESFRNEVIKYRIAGYFDWQILLALYNVILDQKAKNILRQNGKTYSNDEEWLEDFKKVIHELKYLDEKESYVEIPMEYIIGKDFDFQIEHLTVHVLESFGLENKSRFPNPRAIKEFLNKRFNFAIDDVSEISPFKF